MIQMVATLLNTSDAVCYTIIKYHLTFKQDDLLYTKHVNCHKASKFQDWPPGARTANGIALCH
jgi:hypothetical protein